MNGPREFVRRNVSLETRRRVAMARVGVRRVGASSRALPDFLIIGTQRGGTSSLYRYLGAHPDVVPALRKETEYFSTEYRRGESWYRAHFPRRTTRPAVTFEATPAYLLHPLAADRAAALLPGAGVIAMLRDPAARAFSQHRHNCRLGNEPLSFGKAIAAEPERLRGEYERIQRDPDYQAIPLRRFGYVERGLYARQLERWFARFDRVLVVSSEDFMRDPRPVFSSVLDFLGLDQWAPDAFANYSYRDPATRPGAEMPGDVRNELEIVFRAPNARLRDLLDRDFDWGS
jgi:hypothetical protein